MRRICAALATLLSVLTALFVTIALAGPAWAKGPETATLAGPGLDQPIDVFSSTEENRSSYLVIALTDLTSLWEPANVELTSEAPTEHLGERYTLTWQMYGPSDADPADYTVRQDLYPNARFGGPVVHLHPSSYLDTEGGWFQAAEALRETLAALGVPVTGLQPGPVRAGTGTGSAGAADRGVDPAVVRETVHEAAAWPTAVAAVGGIGAGLGLAWALPRLARRRLRGRRAVAEAA